MAIEKDQSFNVLVKPFCHGILSAKWDIWIMRFAKALKFAVIFASIALPQTAFSQAAHSIKFDRIEAELPMGEVFVRGKRGLLCIPHEAHTWDQAKSWLKIDIFERAFHDVARAQGLPVAGDPTSMFGDTGFDDADLLVGASIKRFSIDACAPLSSNIVKGTSSLEIEWQVFSKREGRLIFRGTTRSQYRLEKAIDGGVFKLVLEPFRENVRQLAGSRELQGAILAAR